MGKKPMRCEITRKHEVEYKCENTEAMPLAYTTDGKDLIEWLDLNPKTAICAGCRMLVHWAAGRARMVMKEKDNANSK